MYSPVQKINSYSLTDFHDFEDCSFRFFVRHHLDKKYLISKGSPQLSLGVLLDKTIKNIHKYKAYDKPQERLIKAVRFSAKEILEAEARNPKKPNFDTQTVKFLNEEILTAAESIFANYLNGVKGGIKKSLGEIGFCKKYLKIDDTFYCLWGGPDTLEEGNDGIPEIIDYKSRQDIAKGKQYMDMELMPKMYTLLVADTLLKRGYKKARFMVRFWQDPKEESFAQEFDLENLTEHEDLFKEKIQEILKAEETQFCITEFCDACNYVTKDQFALDLKNKFGISIIVR
jgi:hypothetical protein